MRFALSVDPAGWKRGGVADATRFDLARKVYAHTAQYDGAIGNYLTALMPDGTLLSLERSVAVDTPIYLNRIFEVNPASATDVSVAPFNTGLIGQTYTPVAKSLLWSRAIDASFGQNMEGLTLGPRLANGDWSLIGVRFALYLTLAALFGLSAFSLYGLRLRERGSALALRPWLVASGTLGLLFSVAWVVMMASSMAGTPVWPVDHEAIAGLLTGSAIGAAWKLRMVMLVLATVAAMFAAGRRASSPLALHPSTSALPESCRSVVSAEISDAARNRQSLVRSHRSRAMRRFDSSAHSRMLARAGARGRMRRPTRTTVTNHCGHSAFPDRFRNRPKGLYVRREAVAAQLRQ